VFFFSKVKRNQVVVGGPCVLMYLLGRFVIHIISDRQGNSTYQSMFYLKYVHKSHTDVCTRCLQFLSTFHTILNIDIVTKIKL
jgi:hypothetical protein